RLDPRLLHFIEACDLFGRPPCPVPFDWGEGVAGAGVTDQAFERPMAFALLLELLLRHRVQGQDARIVGVFVLDRIEDGAEEEVAIAELSDASLRSVVPVRGPQDRDSVEPLHLTNYAR